eukprot:3176719-Amphidinium_carterae.1
MTQQSGQIFQFCFVHGGALWPFWRKAPSGIARFLVLLGYFFWKIVRVKVRTLRPPRRSLRTGALATWPNIPSFGGL